MPTATKVAATIAEIIEHAPDLRSYILVPERRVPTFLPGQFLHLAIDPYESGSHWPDSRVFSIASSPTSRQQLRVTISRQGAFTSRMFSELALGARVWLKLPYGSFCPNPDLPGRLVLLAGGSGITPFVSFLQWAVAAKPGAAIDLHYGARTADLLIYRSAIERCRADGLSHLRPYYYVERVDDATLGGGPVPIIHGRLTVERAWAELAAPAEDRFYLSGPRAMIDDFRARLVQLGARPEAVLSDDWS